jgi:hypothetical protein
MMRLTVSLLFLLFSFSAVAQKQLILLKKGKPMHRFNAGDDIYIKIKGNPDRIHSYVNNILDDALVLHHDTIPFHTIERTYLEEGSLLNLFGGMLVTAGTGYFLIDQVNELTKGNDLSINKGVAIGSATCVVVGLPMMLTRKKSQKLSYKYRLLTVKAGDPLYR